METTVFCLLMPVMMAMDFSMCWCQSGICTAATVAMSAMDMEMYLVNASRSMYSVSLSYSH